jgi:uncharacterized peroxidase-related enzyme
MWIKTISYNDSTGRLRRLYDRVKGPDNNVDNIMMAHSLRPHSMEGHMALYKNVLHHSGNQMPKHYLETVGVYVSLLNECRYCVDHHYAGLTRLLGDKRRSAAIYAALAAQRPADAFDGKDLAGLEYAAELTLSPTNITEDRINGLRTAGFDDGEILELNQVSAYFSYANRTVLGLGIHSEGDIIGLSPNDSANADNWSHS